MNARLFDMISKLPGYQPLRAYRERLQFRKPNPQEPVRQAFYSQFVKHLSYLNVILFGFFFRLVSSRWVVRFLSY